MKRLYKSRLLLISGAMTLALSASGSTDTPPDQPKEVLNLVVELKTGDDEHFVIAKDPRLVFNDDECIFSVSDYEVIHSLADIRKAYFAMLPDMSGVDDIADSGISVDMSTPGVIVIKGLSPHTGVTVHNIDGRMIASASASDDGEATVDISRIADNTVYIVSVSNIKNFKFYKR